MISEPLIKCPFKTVSLLCHFSLSQLQQSHPSHIFLRGTEKFRPRFKFLGSLCEVALHKRHCHLSALLITLVGCLLKTHLSEFSQQSVEPVTKDQKILMKAPVPQRSSFVKYPTNDFGHLTRPFHQIIALYADTLQMYLYGYI